jgi:hypothetical protein
MRAVVAEDSKTFRSMVVVTPGERRTDTTATATAVKSRRTIGSVNELLDSYLEKCRA